MGPINVMSFELYAAANGGIGVHIGNAHPGICFGIHDDPECLLSLRLGDEGQRRHLTWVHPGGKHFLVGRRNCSVSRKWTDDFFEIVAKGHWFLLLPCRTSCNRRARGGLVGSPPLGKLRRRRAPLRSSAAIAPYNRACRSARPSTAKCRRRSWRGNESLAARTTAGNFPRRTVFWYRETESSRPCLQARSPRRASAPAARCGHRPPAFAGRHNRAGRPFRAD